MVHGTTYARPDGYPQSLRINEPRTHIDAPVRSPARLRRWREHHVSRVGHEPLLDRRHLRCRRLRRRGLESSLKPTSPSSVAPALPQTFTLSGMVTEVSGAGVVPVSGALVQETRFQRGATSDADGHYSISGVPAGSGFIRISKNGYVSSTSNLDISADATLNVRVMPIKTYILSGVVFEITASGRRAVEGAELYCDSCGSPVGHTFTASDARGRYQFAWSVDGGHILLVWKEGYVLAHPAGSYSSSRNMSRHC